ncbi:MAG: hypothetical protein R3315_05910 [Woeseiaceae bacterium]|nr:hypothetical protein [Woeseiaceae bacterium]
MIRNTIAFLAGLGITFLLIVGIESLGHAIYPVQAGVDFSDPDAMRAYVATLPIPALLFPLAAYFIATFVGVIVASLIGTLRAIVFAAVIGLFVLAGTIANLLLIPHPLWFAVLAILGIAVSAWLAAELAGRRAAEPSDDVLDA